VYKIKDDPKTHNAQMLLKMAISKASCSRTSISFPGLFR